MIMSNSRRQLIKKIARLNHNLHYQQARVKLHKRYLMHLIYDHRVTLIVTLLPAFVWGWHQGQRRAKGLGAALKQIVQMGLMTVFTHVKGQFFKHHPLLK